MARLSRRQVLAIREMWELGETIREIAKQYKRAESTISDVVHLRTYVRVQPGEVAYVPGEQQRNASIKSYASGFASSSSEVGSEDRRFQRIYRGIVLHGPIPPNCLYRMPEIVIVQDC